MLKALSSCRVVYNSITREYENGRIRFPQQMHLYIYAFGFNFFYITFQSIVLWFRKGILMRVQYHKILFSMSDFKMMYRSLKLDLYDKITYK